MSVSFWLYATHFLSSVSFLLGFLCIFFLIGVFVIMSKFQTSGVGIDECCKDARICFVLFLCCLAVFILIPSKKTMYMMIAANYLEDSNVPRKLIDVLNLKLDDILEEAGK